MNLKSPKRSESSLVTLNRKNGSQKASPHTQTNSFTGHAKTFNQSKQLVCLGDKGKEKQINISSVPSQHYAKKSFGQWTLKYVTLRKGTLGENKDKINYP